MISLSLNPANWSASTGEIHNRAEGYPLDPVPFSVAEVATTNGLLPQLQAIIGHFVQLGNGSGWEIVSMDVNQIGDVQDFSEPPADATMEELAAFVPAALGDPRPTLELPVTLRASETYPTEAVRGKIRSDTWQSEALPLAVRDALIAFYLLLRE